LIPLLGSIMHDDGLARKLGASPSLVVALDDGIEYHLLEMGFLLLFHYLVRKAKTTVIHG